MSSIAVFFVLGGATAFAATKIGANELKANAVKTGKIVKEAVTTSKLKNGAATTSKLGKNAVTGEKIADLAVTNTKIADSAVSTTKIADSAVSTTKIAAGAVTAGKLGSSAVNEANIASPLRSRWARVRDNGTLVVGRNVVSSTLTGTGVYDVVFNSDVSACGFVPARGTTGFEPSPSFIGARGLAGAPDTVRVQTFDNTGSAIGRDFTLLVVC
jgi:hypothetical protein